MGDIVFSNAYDAYSASQEIAANNSVDAADPPDLGSPSAVESVSPDPDATLTDAPTDLPTDWRRTAPNRRPARPDLSPSYSLAAQDAGGPVRGSRSAAFVSASHSATPRRPRATAPARARHRPRH